MVLCLATPFHQVNVNTESQNITQTTLSMHIS